MTKKPDILTKDEVDGVHLRKMPAHFKKTLGRAGFSTVLPDAPTPAGLNAMLMRHFRGLQRAVFFQDHLKPIVCCILIFKPSCWWSLGIYQAWVKRRAAELLREKLPVGSKLAGVWW